MKRFAVELYDGVVVGVECKTYDWGLYGICFSNPPEKGQSWANGKFIVLACAPESWRWFREIEGEWAANVVYVYKQQEGKEGLNANID